MKRFRMMVLAPLLGLTLTACPEPADEPMPAPRTGDPEATDRPVCLLGEPFVADGEIPVDANGGGDAHRVVGLRGQAYDGCERFVIDLEGEDGAAAGSAGAVAAEVLRDLGVVRVSLRDVRWVDPEATDATFDGELARAAYSVWSPDGRWTFVDLHLASEAEAFATALPDPARVVVDLRPGGGAVPTPPATARHVVVLEPRAGTAAYPLTVTGYARTFEANVVVRVEQDGEDVHETFTTATAWADAWGHYSLTIDDGPSGPIRLHVGDYSARDGTWEGAVVDLTLR
jgi:hypothetical protein